MAVPCRPPRLNVLDRGDVGLRHAPLHELTGTTDAGLALEDLGDAVDRLDAAAEEHSVVVFLALRRSRHLPPGNSQSVASAHEDRSNVNGRPRPTVWNGEHVVHFGDLANNDPAVQQ